MKIIDNLVKIERNERLVATIKEVEIDGKKYFYKQFEGVLLPKDKEKFRQFDFRPLEGIIKPVIVKDVESELNGYLMPYREGKFLSKIIYSMPLDELIKGLEGLTEAYLNLANEGFELSSVSLEDLMLTEEGIVNIGIDNIAKSKTHRVFTSYNNINGLKEFLKSIFDDVLRKNTDPSLQPLRNVLSSCVGPSRAAQLVTPSEMVRRFRDAMIQYYAEDFESISKMHAKVGENNGYSNSGTHLRR